VSPLPPLRSWLYAPGNNPRLLEKVFTAGADAVILDLEDAVPPHEKERARDMVAEAVRGRAGKSSPATFVRLNHPDGELVEDEIRAVVQPGLAGVRLPKVEDAATVAAVGAWLSAAEVRAGLPENSVALVCLIETARGVWHADTIASASQRVMALSFGGVDMARDLGLHPSGDGTEMLYLRSRVVLVSRVAGLRPPVDGVYTQLQDDEGLDRTTRQGRALGFFGRAALHPRQVDTINAVYTPSEAEIAWAQGVIAAAADAEVRGSGALQLTSGEFVDAPVVRRAEGLLTLSRALAR
jgi:citrate lyase subunit beta/citryl-CoA lyase